MKKCTRIIGNIIFYTFMLIIVFELIITLTTKVRGEEPSLLGYKLYYVASGSMTPALPVGSLIIVRETDAAGIKNSDIITFKGVSGTVITHRVVEVFNDKKSFKTRGDANNTNDPMPVALGNVLGKVVLHIPYVGYLMNFFKTRYGLIVIAAVITYMMILNLVLPKQKLEKS
ncbi:MAG: signal peptidase I [Bacillota bacterium]|nr:signal peptidase I [Bacillota bacterium]